MAAPGKLQRRKPVWLCPFCRSVLYFWHRHQEFNAYKCYNKDCDFLKTYGQHYNYRDYQFDLASLQLASPSPPRFDLSRTRFSV